MKLEEKLEQDIKAALLSGDKVKATTLRGLKAVLLNAKVAQGKRDEGLNDEAVLAIFAKQSKQRQESADMYVQGGAQDKADAELTEKAVIDAYLPAQLSDEDISVAIDEAITATGANGPQDMGKVIGSVKAKLGASADGAVIARLVKEKLSWFF